MLFENHAFTLGTIHKLCIVFVISFIDLSYVRKVYFCVVLRILVWPPIVCYFLRWSKHVLVDDEWSLFSISLHGILLLLRLDWINLAFFVWLFLSFLKIIKVRPLLRSFNKNLPTLMIFISTAWFNASIPIVNILVKLTNHVLEVLVNLNVMDDFLSILLLFKLKSLILINLFRWCVSCKNCIVLTFIMDVETCLFRQNNLLIFIYFLFLNCIKLFSFMSFDTSFALLCMFSFAPYHWVQINIVRILLNSWRIRFFLRDIWNTLFILMSWINRL